MRLSPEVLLHLRVLRGERESKNRSTGCPPGHQPAYRAGVESEVESELLRVQAQGGMRPRHLSSTLDQAPQVPPPYFVRWTRYGQWSEDGLRVVGERGNVIYELGPLRKRAT